MKELIDAILNIIKGIFFPVAKTPIMKVECKYLVISKKHAEGVLYFRNLECKFVSGKWGKGYAPQGIYKAYKCIDEDREAFVTHGIGYQVPIEPQFETDREFLAIHPDGGVEGTLGCIGLIPENADHALRIKNAFKHWFEVHPSLDVEIC